MFDYPPDHGLDSDPAAAPLDADGAKSYEELYVEHATAARRLALSLVPSDVADDIVAEAFARVLAAIRAGGGPSSTFRGYLLTSVRNLANDWLRTRRRLTVVADMDVGDMDVQAGHPAAAQGRVTPGMSSAAETQVAARDEARLVARAFGGLPARWRAVLWQLEVEGKAPAAVAPMFGMSANGVSALAMRAREGLRQAYLEEHVGTNIPQDCRTYAAGFGAGARGTLSQRRRAAMQEHLGHCPACQNLFTELTELNSRLGSILTPAALAAAAAKMGSGHRAMMIHTGLNGTWRTWRLHPVTAAVGAAAGVAVAGGMLFAVNVTPVPSSPSHVTVQAAVPPGATSGPAVRRRAPSGGGGGSGGGGASLAGTGSRAAGGSPAGATPPSGPSGSTLPAGTLPASSATGGAVGSAAGTTVTGVTSAAGTTVSVVTGAAGTAVTGVTGAAGGAVAGVSGAAGGAVAGVTGAAGGAVTGVTSAAGTTVSVVPGAAGTAVTGVTGKAGSAVTGVTGTAGAAVAGAGQAASGLASTTAGKATTVAAATTNAARPIVTSATDTASSVAATTTDTASSVAASTTDTASTAAAATTGLASAATTAAATTAATDIGGTSAAAATAPEALTASVGSTAAATTTGVTSAAAVALQP